MYVGLDFGTSNSSIARLKQGQIQMFTLDEGTLNPRMLRSFIFIDRAQQSYVGSQAIRKYQELETGRPVYWETRNMGQIKMVVASGGSSPIVYWDDLLIQVDTNAQGRLIQSIKTGLRRPEYDGTKIFEQHYAIEDLIAILLKALKHRCEQATGEPIEGVMLGRPVKFSDQTEVDARAQEKLEAAARLAGFEKVAFELEPIAAAYVYHRQVEERQAALVFDFGGGTLDLTVMEVGSSQPPEVLATRGVLVGGDDLDRTLMAPLKKHFGEGATLRDRTPLPAHLMEMLDSWQTMVLLSRPEYRSLLRSARRGSSPEAIQRLETLVNKNLGFNLFQEVERCKIKLSREATALLTLEAEGFRLKEMLTRPHFERLVEPYVQQVEADIDAVLENSGLKAGQVQAVLRTGGSSEVPAFIRMLTRKFGHDRLRPLNPFETIVGGLAIRAGEMG